MLKWLLGIGLLACVWAAPAEAACAGGTCFVVAAGGNSSANTTWTLTSGGSACTCTPGTTDAVILDSLAGQLTLNASLSVGTFDASGTGGSGSPYTNTLTQASTTVLTINTAAANSLKFSSQMTYSPGVSTTTTVTFANTSGTAQITSNGKNFAGILVNGVGGTAQQLDDISITAQTGSALTVTNGVWDANGFAITAGIVASNNSNVRGLTLGGLVKIGGNVANAAAIWSVSTGGTFTFTKNSANIEVVTPTSAIQGTTFTGAGLTYNSLTLDNASFKTTLNITGANGFTNVTIGSGWLVFFPSATTNTLSGALTVTGTASSFSAIEALSSNAVATISAVGACTTVYTVIYGITGTGTCTWIGTNSISLGTTSGWTITAPSFGGGGGYIIGN